MNAVKSGGTQTPLMLLFHIVLKIFQWMLRNAEQYVSILFITR